MASSIQSGQLLNEGQSGNENEDEEKEEEGSSAERSRLSTRVSEIIPETLYLSDMTFALNYDMLQSFEITHIVNATNKHAPNKFESMGIVYFNVNLDDTEECSLSPWFAQTFRFIDEALSVSGGRVLVHCMCGISRSGSLVVGYVLHRSPSMSLKQAFELVKEKRTCVAPNPAFADDLLSLEMRLRNDARASLKREDMVSPNYQRCKQKAGATRALLDRFAEPDEPTTLCGTGNILSTITICAVQ